MKKVHFVGVGSKKVDNFALDKTDIHSIMSITLVEYKELDPLNMFRICLQSYKELEEI